MYRFPACGAAGHHFIGAKRAIHEGRGLGFHHRGQGVPMFGALFLMIIAIIPTLLLKVLNITVLSAFGPTSILIMISVSIEIADQLDSLMIMRNHKGFLN